MANFKTEGTYLYSKAANGYVSVGATFDSYSYAKHSFTGVFKLAKSLEIIKSELILLLNRIIQRLKS